ncbi:DHH family phosphoesterase [Anaerorhabdus sp.]|jgi:bifunctional oligoribonuclease and PAP phosphatase NrnA|uniref:DHH family phosphoesterase n=1 Tax=Anaerorhabdus sp. TaxID=1872524 RepID=UPI002FC68486
MKNIFQETLVKFDVITIFRHENPDMDALGSQLGLFNWIKDNYPNKQVFVCGYDFGRHQEFNPSTDIPDSIIESSLAIILDTANSARVDDNRYKLAKETMQIDHHPHNEIYANIEIIKEEDAATCQILSEIFNEIDANTISLKTAEYLYKGILTDTLCFRTNNTTPNTLLVASVLASRGINISKINQEVFDIDINTFKFITVLRSKVTNREGVAYAIITADDVAPFNLSLNQAREYVSELGSVKEYQIWCIFTEDNENPEHYKGSIRSKVITINDVASRYNGGGHKNACGVKNLTISQVYSLLDELNDLL